MAFRDEHAVAKKLAPFGVRRGFIPEISPYRIKLYSKCPNKFLLEPTATAPQHPEEIILSDIIKYAFFRHSVSQSRIPPKWKAFVNWLDQFRLRHTRLISEDMADYYKESEWLLVRLSKWYNEFYLPHYAIEGVINVPVVLTVDDLTYYRDFLDIMTINPSSGVVTVFDFCYEKKKMTSLGTRIYNDLEVLARVWGIYKSTDVKIDKYVRIFLSNKTIQVKEIDITDQYLQKGQCVIGHLINGMTRQIYYPSHSEQCFSCAYRKRCRLF